MYLTDLPKDDFVWQLPERLDLLHPVVVEMVHQQRLTPDVLEKVVLLEHGIVKKVQVEVVGLLLHKNRLSFHPESIV